MSQTDINIDPQEIAKFDEIAFRWWDKESEFKPLHEINPLRLDFIERFTPLEGKKVIDIGCGGGVLSEGMAQRGAQVTGIDMAQTALEVAKLHLFESGLQVDYHHSPAEDFAEEHVEEYDLITCMEMLEHVPDPSSIIAACTKMLKPGGQIFLSTLNRNPKSYLFSIIGAEYILKLLPKGTHEYTKFIKPSELESWMRHAGLQMKHMKGLGYNPITKQYFLNDDIQVNYLVHGIKAG